MVNTTVKTKTGNGDKLDSSQVSLLNKYLCVCVLVPDPCPFSDSVSVVETRNPRIPGEPVLGKFSFSHRGILVTLELGSLFFKSSLHTINTCTSSISSDWLYPVSHLLCEQ